MLVIWFMFLAGAGVVSASVLAAGVRAARSPEMRESFVAAITAIGCEQRLAKEANRKTRAKPTSATKCPPRLF